MLFYPSKYPDGDWEPNELQFEDVWMTSGDGKKIHGWYCPCENARANLLYFHGNAGNLSHRTEWLVRLQYQLNIAVLIFDYRGYGRSSGRPTIAGIAKDSRAASQFLAEKVSIPESELIYMGRSLGGAIAIQLATTVQPKGLIVHNTFSSLRKIAGHHFPLLSWIVPGWILNSESSIKSYNGDVLISHGTQDQIVPFQQGVEIFDSANEPKSFVRMKKNAHNDSLPASYIQELERFIRRLEVK